MAQKSDSNLSSQSTTIRDETGTNLNTASRIGNVLLDIVDSKVNNVELGDYGNPITFSSNIVLTCLGAREPKFNIVGANANFTISFDELRGDGEVGVYSNPCIRVQKIIAGDITVTLQPSGGFTNLSMPGTAITQLVLSGPANKTFFIVCHSIGNASAAEIRWGLSEEVGAGTSIDVIDEDDMASNSATKVPTQQSVKAYVDGQSQTEINRTWTETLLFDKDNIFYAPIVMTGPLSYELAGSGHLVDKPSSAIQTVTADGINPIIFGDGFQYIYGITNGQVLEAGTYEVYFLYSNGIVRVNVPGVSAQQSSIVPLSAPGNLTATPDGETAIDLSWDDVDNETGYVVEFSTDNTTWSPLDTLDADATSTTQSGLTAGTQRFYRIKAIGDGVHHSDSPYASTSTITDSTGGAPPTFVFSPEDDDTDAAVNRSITITASAPIQKTDGTELTDANINDVLTLKQTNSGGTDIGFTATINVGKTLITITPDDTYGVNQLVYVAINNVEGVSNNEEVTTPEAITFTTGEFTKMNGTSNAVVGDDILNDLFTENDAHFKLAITLRDIPLSGTRMLHTKYASVSNQRSFYWYTSGNALVFIWSHPGELASRGVKFAGGLLSTETTYELEYNGAVDTNNGLDRVSIKRNGVTLSTKELQVFSNNPLSTINASAARLSFGAGVNSSGGVETPAYHFAGEAKDFKVLDGEDTVIIDIPNLRNGQDVSGNNYHMTWVS